MKKYTLTLFILLISYLSILAQFPNEWIDYDKTYFKFTVSETGVYRISYEILENAGIDVVGKDFQLFCKGEEIPIYVTQDGSFGSGDFIEFYGEYNDGSFDTQLFANKNHQLQTKNSLFTTASAYFLTSTASNSNKRYEAATNDITNAPPKEDYFMFESYETYSNNFHFGEPNYTSGAFSFFSTFDEGEGFTGSIIRNTYNELDLDSDGDIDTILQNTGDTYRIYTENLYPDADKKARVKATLVGKNTSTAVVWDKHVRVSMFEAGQIDTTVFVVDSFKKFEIKQIDFDVDLKYIESTPDFAGRTRTKVNFVATDGVTYGWPYESKFAMSILSIDYPRDFNFNNKEYFEFDLSVSEDKYLEIENFNGGSNPILYDVTDGTRFIPVQTDGKYKFLIEPTASVSRKFVFVNTDESSMKIKQIEQLDKKNYTDFSGVEVQGDYIIVTHNKLREGTVDQISRYKQYRESNVGGSYKVAIADIEELYDQFAWGIDKHPMAMKFFLNYAYSNWDNQPKLINIIGKGVSYHNTRTDSLARSVCLIPPFGHSATDLMFTSQTTQNYFPIMAIGRIPAKTPDEVRAYLDKVVEYDDWITNTKDCDKITDRKWMKNIIHIAKGWGKNETDNFQLNLDVYKEVVINENLGYNVVEEFQDLVGAIPGNLDNNYAPNPGIKTRMEEGLAFINYVGHSAAKVSYWQFDMQSPAEYDNEGKYSFVLSNSCFVGKISDFHDKTCMGEDYILADNRGAIGFLAAVALSSPSFLHLFSKDFIKNLSIDNYGKTIGECIQSTIQDIYDPNDDNVRVVCNEFTYAGDPAIKAYQWEQPEYLLDDASLSLNPTEDLDPANVSELEVSFQLQNWGKSNATEMVDVVISQYDDENNLVNEYIETIQRPVFETMVDFTIPLALNSPSGINKFVIEIDGNKSYSEDCTENNIAERTVVVTNSNLGGCTDQCATNFNPDAVFNDGSCQEYDNTCNSDCEVGEATIWDTETCSCILDSEINCSDVEGCTDQCAPNFNPDANIDDDSCTEYNTACNADCSLGNLTEWDEEACDCVAAVLTISGCTDATALNYNADANCDDNSCEFEGETIEGCTESSACNYNPDATVNDGSCDFGVPDCLDGCNAVLGCVDVEALNYNPDATCDDGTCDFGSGINDINAFRINVGPLPANSIVNFHMELTSSSNIEIELFTIDGKLIDVIANDFYHPGKTTVTYSVNSLNSGLYLYRINDGADDVTGRISVVR